EDRAVHEEPAAAADGRREERREQERAARAEQRERPTQEAGEVPDLQRSALRAGESALDGLDEDLGGLRPDHRGAADQEAGRRERPDRQALVLVDLDAAGDL